MARTLIEIMDSRMVTVRDLSNSTGLTVQSLYRISRGQVRVRPENRRLIEQALGQPVDWLATGLAIHRTRLSDTVDCEDAFIGLVQRINGLASQQEKVEFIRTARRHLQRLKKELIVKP